MNSHRNLTREEKWVSEYESLVNYICEGYEEIIYEYTNDLTCRLFIQQALEEKNKDILSMKERIERADKKLRTVLLETKECIYGKYPKNYFWFWGVPGNSEELTNEAKTNKWI
jgi:hypothetical protein